MSGHSPLAPGSNAPVQYQPVPLWRELAPAFGFVTAPPTASAPRVMTPTVQAEQLESSKKPRPRKPYTATKTREMWSPEEHARMLEGLKRFKRDWSKVTEFVGTRSPAQVRSHAQKYFDRVARDKTDDYVPQARPKRKSATPYPRKVRSEQQPQVAVHQIQHPPPAQVSSHDHQNLQYQVQQHGTVPVAYPVNSFGHVVAPGAPPQYLQHSSSVQPIAYALHPHVHPQLQPHPVYNQGTPHPHLSPQLQLHSVPHPPMVQQPQNPSLSAVTVDPSRNPCPQNYPFFPAAVVDGCQSPQLHSQAVLQSSPSHVFGQVPGGTIRLTRVYSPYITVNGFQSNPQVPSPLYSASPHPHPGPCKGQSCADQSPYPTAEDASQVPGHPSFYSALSPLTPAVPYGLCSSPASQQIQGNISMRSGEKPPHAPHVPSHSHPGGPDPNCAKCSALKRFGNVLHEIGALHKSKGEGQPTVCNSDKTPVSTINPKANGHFQNSDSDFPPGSLCATPSLVEPTSRPQPPVSVRRISHHYNAARPHHVPVQNIVCLSPRVSNSPATDSNSDSGLKCRTGSELPSLNVSVVNLKKSSPSDQPSGEQGTTGSSDVLDNSTTRKHQKARKSQSRSVSGAQKGMLDLPTPPLHKKNTDVPARLPQNGAEIAKRWKRRSGSKSPLSKSLSSSGEMRNSRKRASSTKASDIFRKKSKTASETEKHGSGSSAFSRNEERELLDAVLSLQTLGRTPTPERN